jgi:hypothetical protein
LLALVGDDLQEVVRQQWNFSPGGTTEELEDYRVELDGVNALDLRIDPDRSHDPKQSRHIASLQRLRLARRYPAISGSFVEPGRNVRIADNTSAPRSMSALPCCPNLDWVGRMD